MHPDLLETLRSAQRFGFFGNRPIEEAAEHSMEYVRALGVVASPSRLVDLGSGGGLPGLVLADALPDVDVLLIDRRQKRTDFLERAVTGLRMTNVEVLCADVTELIRSVRNGGREPFEIVTARGFGPPEVTIRSGAALLARGGRILISEPPEGDRWSADLLAELGLRSERRGAVRVFWREDDRAA
jgi:16S rRNA (guanine527-N7)-methyltransferase